MSANTAALAAPADLHRTSRLASLAAVGLVIALGVIVALGGWLWLGSRDSVAWQLDGYGRPTVVVNAQTTDFSVFVASRPDMPDLEWLDPPTITYTPVAVLITLHTSAAYRAALANGPHGTYDTGQWVEVHLSEPLGGRALLDGSSFPPASR